MTPLLVRPLSTCAGLRLQVGPLRFVFRQHYCCLLDIFLGIRRMRVEQLQTGSCTVVIAITMPAFAPSIDVAAASLPFCATSPWRVDLLTFACSCHEEVQQ